MHLVADGDVASGVVQAICQLTGLRQLCLSGYSTTADLLPQLVQLKQPTTLVWYSPVNGGIRAATLTSQVS
jgi:hypothetical protein